MNKATDNKKAMPLPVLIATPVFILIICVVVICSVGVTPYNKISKYMSIIFMNNYNTTTISAIDLNENSKHPLTYSSDGTIIYPYFGDQYAVITCENINLNAPVYWGSSDTLLQLGVCQYTSSSTIGEKGNVVLDAHVNTFFSELDKMETGDIVVLTTDYGRFTYKAKEIVYFEDDDITYISPTDDDRLTLYTCVMEMLGPSSTRIGVICELVSKEFYNN